MCPQSVLKCIEVTNYTVKRYIIQEDGTEHIQMFDRHFYSILDFTKQWWRRGACFYEVFQRK